MRLVPLLVLVSRTQRVGLQSSSQTRILRGEGHGGALRTVRFQLGNALEPEMLLHAFHGPVKKGVTRKGDVAATAGLSAFVRPVLPQTPIATPVAKSPLALGPPLQCFASEEQIE